MHIPLDALIAVSKLGDYLLKPREEDDKSGLLSEAGFTADNPDALLAAIRSQSQAQLAQLQRHTPFGAVYTVFGDLNGPNGRTLQVRTVWIARLDGIVAFITLVPKRE